MLWQNVKLTTTINLKFLKRQKRVIAACFLCSKMGKNHRHKKKLKSEKAKVHITSKTKFLPKGQNVTDTTFKIKPIVIPEQLKERDQSVLLSKRKSSIPELISKMKHFNENVKTDACQELKDMIKHHSSEIIQTHLSTVIQTASTLMQDRDKKVRKACVGLFGEIFEKVSTLKLDTFFTYILINLKCAMTNIDKNIQEDSLLVLDALLEHKPLLIAQNFEKIFPDFLTLISKLRSQATPDRTLTLNLGSKLTSVKWRIKVLSRLYGILDAMIKNNYSQNENIVGKNDTTIYCNANESSFIPIYKNSKFYENSSINFFGNHTQEATHTALGAHVTVLVPLLYETWLEVMPEKSSKKTSTETTVLSEEPAAVLSCVISLLRLLHEYSQLNGVEELFSSKDGAKFLEHLILNFPYGQNRKPNSEFTKDFSKLLTPNHDTACVEENLIIIYLFITFKAHAKSNNKTQKLNFVTNYLTKCLTLNNRFSQTSFKYLVKILDEILIKKPKLWHRYGLDNVEIMEHVIKFYEKGRIPEAFKTDILDILTCLNAPFRYDKQQEWLGKLPSCLCGQQISEKLVDVILNLCKQNHELTQESVKNLLGPILDNLPDLKITETSNREAVEMKIAYIFFYLGNLSSDDYKLILNFIEKNKNMTFGKHFQNMLDFKQNLCY